jgi:hypothetical protein
MIANCQNRLKLDEYQEDICDIACILRRCWRRTDTNAGLGGGGGGGGGGCRCLNGGRIRSSVMCHT